MTNKELTEWLEWKRTDDEYHVPDDDIRAIDEITQILREYAELKKLISEVVDPLIELCNFLLAVSGDTEISNFQDGDINYGRK